MVKSLQSIINDRIRELLSSIGKNQEWLSSEAEIAKGHLSEILNCRNNKHWDDQKIEKVSRAFGIPAWHIFIDPIEAGFITNEDREIINAYRGLDEDDRKVVDKFLGIKVERKKDVAPTKKTAM